MIRKIVNKHSLNDSSAQKQDLNYWLSQSPESRIAAVELLRKQHHGSTARLQRIARVVQLTNKKAAGRKKDVADIEALEE